MCLSDMESGFMEKTKADMMGIIVHNAVSISDGYTAKKISISSDRITTVRTAVRGWMKMKLIDSDKFLQHMAELYQQAGWDEREVHFSLADLRSNIGMEDVILIPRREADMVLAEKEEHSLEEMKAQGTE